MKALGIAAFVGIIICILAVITGAFILIAKLAGVWIWWLLGGVLGLAYVLGVGMIIAAIRGGK